MRPARVVAYAVPGFQLATQTSSHLHELTDSSCSGNALKYPQAASAPSEEAIHGTLTMSGSLGSVGTPKDGVWHVVLVFSTSCSSHGDITSAALAIQPWRRSGMRRCPSPLSLAPACLTQASGGLRTTKQRAVRPPPSSGSLPPFPQRAAESTQTHCRRAAAAANSSSSAKTGSLSDGRLAWPVFAFDCDAAGWGRRRGEGGRARMS